jgi:hypothetical protein
MQLIPLTDPAAMIAAGVPFATSDSARWAFRKRFENGLDGAFIRLGKRIYLDPAKFHELIRNGQ